MSFLNARMNIWIVFILFLIFTAAFAAFFIYFRNIEYRYSLFIPNDKKEPLALEYGEWPALSNANFYNKVRDNFISQKASFIEADLSEMKLKLYENGSSTKEFSILAKGKKGSWWETPAGLYKIENKEKNHFSSFGKVYQPWSMQFQGNFFIHGWPYYPDGTPVESTYSGGCIRLATDDAEEIFGWTKVGMPVLVYEKNSLEADEFSYERKLPEISAKNFLAADIKNNFVFMKKGENDVLPVASITKLITSLVAVEYINIEKNVIVPESAIVPTSKPRLKAGQKFSVYELLHPLLLESSNEAGETLADYLGKERFISLMNKKAQALGMESTRFMDASGANGGNISTAQDLFMLSKHLYFNRSFILKFTSGKKLANSLYGPIPFSDLQNFNIFGVNPEFVGGKTGKSNSAGETMLAVFEIKLNGEKRPIAIIILDSENAETDINMIIDYIKSNY